uniref:Uncharacterized protein n=1 Tax=Oryza punctata TaxID=4537 RepID=A0A0E0L6A9_ORYPU
MATKGGLAAVAGRMLRRHGGLGSSSRGLSGQPPSHQLTLVEMSFEPEPERPKMGWHIVTGVGAFAFSVAAFLRVVWQSKGSPKKELAANLAEHKCSQMNRSADMRAKGLSDRIKAMEKRQNMIEGKMNNNIEYLEKKSDVQIGRTLDLLREIEMSKKWPWQR